MIFFCLLKEFISQNPSILNRKSPANLTVSNVIPLGSINCTSLGQWTALKSPIYLWRASAIC